jgi:nitrite reductase (NADH) small subunit
MIRYVNAGKMSELAVGRPKRITVADIDLALFYIGGQFYAVQNECPHQHYSALHESIVNGLEITCPMHGWSFDLTTGKATVGGGRLKCYSVKVVGNDVLVEEPNPNPDWASR